MESPEAPLKPLAYVALPGWVHRARWRPAWLAVAFALAGCSLQPANGADLAADTVLSAYRWIEPAHRWPLPRSLREISGLAVLDERRVLAHHDNDSTLWVLAYPGEPSPELLRGQIGGPAFSMDGDFEAVTVHGDAVYLLASPGRLLRVDLDRDGAAGLAAPLRPVSAGLDDRCNFEGMTAAGTALFVACKYPRAPVADTILLYRLESDEEASAAPVAVWVDVAPVLAALGVARLRPSGLTWIPHRQRLLVLAGKERVILEISPEGSLLGWRRLARRHHRQAEGLCFTPGGDILIADEADGRVATLTVYSRERVQGTAQ